MLQFRIKSIFVLVPKTLPASDGLVSSITGNTSSPSALSSYHVRSSSPVAQKFLLKYKVSISEARSSWLSTLKGIKCPVSSHTSVPPSVPQTTGKSMMPPWMRVGGILSSALPQQLASRLFPPTTTNTHSFPCNSTFCIVIENTQGRASHQGTVPGIVTFTGHRQAGPRSGCWELQEPSPSHPQAFYKYYHFLYAPGSENLPPKMNMRVYYS